MKYTFAILATTAAMSIAASAHATDASAEAKSDIEYKDNGGYEAKISSESKDANGTVKTVKATEDYDVDSDGLGSRTTEKTAVTDPEGLFNKSKNTSKTEVERKDNGGYEKTTTEKSTNADGTNVTTEVNTDVDVNDDGSVKANTTTEKTVDPKGLMNKTTTTIKSKAVNGL